MSASPHHKCPVEGRQRDRGSKGPWSAQLMRPVLFLVLALFAVVGHAAESDPNRLETLVDLSLEELMNIEITSVSKKAEPLSQAAAAVFVITAEDIHRSGATSIPEVLRMVPGLEVARVNANRWAVTARGFAGLYAHKLLVLLDGRSVYSPLFSGVFWDVQDTVLADIERIEVIRGPGATLWGANAVNGVINIITRHSSDTIGGLVSSIVGSEDQWLNSLRFGGRIGTESTYRVYAKTTQRDASVDSQGHAVSDDWWTGRGGFRLDWKPDPANEITIQGDVYTGEAGSDYRSVFLNLHQDARIGDTARLDGANLITRWSQKMQNDQQLRLQIYYDRTQRSDVFLKEVRDIFDIDFQHHWRWGRRHQIVWGLGYRFTRDLLSNSPWLSFDTDEDDHQIWSGFLQDEIELIPQFLDLTLGTKIEHNDYTGFELQPSVRLRLMPSATQTIWAAVSRAVRTPSRVEDSGFTTLNYIPPGRSINQTPFIMQPLVSGGRDYDSEELLTCEIGYRTRLWERFAVDATAYYSDYDNLRTANWQTPELVPASDNTPAYVRLPMQLGNNLSGHSKGFELSVEWHPLDRWRFQGSYTYLDLHLPLGRTDSGSPRHQVSLRSMLNLRHDLQFDVWLRRIGGLVGTGSLLVDDYTSLDARLGWQPAPWIEISVAGQNLLDAHHPEVIPEFAVAPSEVERAVYAKVSLRF